MGQVRLGSGIGWMQTERLTPRTDCRAERDGGVKFSRRKERLAAPHHIARSVAAVPGIRLLMGRVFLILARCAFLGWVDYRYTSRRGAGLCPAGIGRKDESGRGEGWV
jgi:hypothetical protein